MSKTSLRRAIIAAISGLALSACTTASLAPQGAQVQVVNSISAGDLDHYASVGSFSAQGMMSIEECYREIRNQAGENGADIIRISSTETDYCTLDFLDIHAPKRCYKMFGDGFRRKKSTETAATKSADQPQI